MESEPNPSVPNPEYSVRAATSPATKRISFDTVRVSKHPSTANGLPPSLSSVNVPSVSINGRGDQQPRCRASLCLILVVQCILVLGIFSTIIGVVNGNITSATKKLVEDRIASDLEFSKGSILGPINSAEELIRAQRLRYIAATEMSGRYPCSEETSALNESVAMYVDALSTIQTHVQSINFVYAIHRSESYFNVSSGKPLTYECGASVDYVYARNRGISRFSNEPVTIQQATAGFPGVPMGSDNVTDYEDDGYVLRAMSYTDFAWWPYLWVEYGTGRVYFSIAGYVPIYLSRTLANGTVETFAPDLFEPQEDKQDKSYTVMSSFAADLSLAHVGSILRSITPHAEGAHTSLYDHDQGLLLATSVVMDMLDPEEHMWPSGATSSELLNTAFRIVNPHHDPHNEANDTMKMVYHNGDIVSSFHVSTPSEVDFIIIQSTPVKFYLANVYSLRTLMIVLGLCAAAIVGIVCVGVALLISRKIAEIEAGMLLAAVLKNDQVQPCRSFITEMDTLCVAFARMNAKLGAARAFMPQSMLVNDETDLDADDDEGDHSSILNTATVQGASLSIEEQSGLRRSQLMNSVMLAATTTTKDTKDSTSKEREKNKADLGGGGGNGMLNKRVTILCINTIGFHRKAADAYAVGSSSRELTTKIHEISTSHRGVIDSFHGDHYILSFNAAKHNAQGPQTAALCGLDIIEALGPTVGFSMGVAAGRALVGHLGSTELKRFSIIGRVYSQAIALERVCKLVSAEGTKGGYSVPQLITDKSTVPEISHAFFLQTLGTIDGISTDQPTLHGILNTCSKASSNEEWLYEVLSNDGNGTLDALLPAVNEAMEGLVTSGDPLSDTLHRFSSAITVAADISANSPALPGREHGRQALLRSLAILRAVSPEAAAKFVHFSL